jgi:uncharacterized lipoprotein YddW (UPF0748 family)
MRRRHAVRAGLGAFVLASAGLGQPGAAQPAEATVPGGEEQIRALWVDAFHDGIKSPAQIDGLVQAVLRAGVNTLIVQVRRRGDAYYNRTGEPRTEDPALRPGFDALQALLDQAHAATPRLEVHAWIATVALWNKKDQRPRAESHAMNRFGPDAGDTHWLSLNDKGQAWDGDNYMLDPGHPGAARYMADVAEELARAYDVDGVHLDLVRYAGAQWGYNPTSVARYRQRFGLPEPASPEPDRPETWDLPGQNDARWQQWRRDQVTALVRRIYLDCLAVKPWLKMTAAVIGWGNGPTNDATWRQTSAYRNVFQDWKSWLEEGIVDVAMPMNYDDEANESQRAWFDRWIAWEREHQGRRQIAAGVGLFLNEPDAGLSQLRRALATSAKGNRLAGAALYSYAVTNKPGQGSEFPATTNDEFFGRLSGARTSFGTGAGPGIGSNLTIAGSVGGISALAEAGLGSGTETSLANDTPLPAWAGVPAMPWKDGSHALLRGTATSAGLPLDGATIRLEGPSRFTATLQTDGNGYFAAVDLVPGDYGLSLVSGGVTRVTYQVTLTGGTVSTLDMDY